MASSLGMMHIVGFYYERTPFPPPCSPTTPTRRRILTLVPRPPAPPRIPSGMTQ